MKRIIGGVVVLVLGGSAFAVSKSGIVGNFSKNTGLSQQQAQQYINNIPKSDLMSFSKLGQNFVSGGSSILNTGSNIDCSIYGSIDLSVDQLARSYGSFRSIGPQESITKARVACAE